MFKIDVINMLKVLFIPIIVISYSISLTLFPELSHAFSLSSYQVNFDLPEDKHFASLRNEIKKLSITEQKKGQQPKSILLLRKRANTDKQEITQFLRSKGYYSSTIQVIVETQEANDKKKEPVYQVHFKIDPGKQYLFDQIKIIVATENSAFNLDGFQQKPLIKDNPALSKSVLETEAALLEFAQKKSYALAKIRPRKAVVEHKKGTMSVELTIDPGPFVKFGAATLSGHTDIKTTFLLNYIAWTQGTPYQKSLLDKTHKDLLATNLFSSVHIRQAKTLNEKGEMPIQIELKQRKFRSIGTGMELNTDTGVTFNFNWEHRNYFQAGEKLEVDLQVSKNESYLRSFVRKPKFLHQNQFLLIGAEFIKEDTDAYEHDALVLSTAIERKLNKKMKASLGVTYSPSRVTDKGTLQKEDFGLLSLPANFEWDFSNHLLNPTQGGRLLLQGAPYVDTFDTGLNFVKGKLSLSYYWPVMDKQRLIIAGRFALGSIMGAERDDVPVDERFYSGGGGSIRGYAYQLAGPINNEEKPIGGNSLFEMAVELRYKVWKEIGLVFFIDSGATYEKNTPEFDNLFVGTGLGIRYDTKLGPIRLDLGFPTDRREDIDDAFQIYISIGQAY